MSLTGNFNYLNSIADTNDSETVEGDVNSEVDENDDVPIAEESTPKPKRKLFLTCKVVSVQFVVLFYVID